MLVRDSLHAPRSGFDTEIQPDAAGESHFFQERGSDAVGASGDAPSVAAVLDGLAERTHFVPVHREQVMIELELGRAVARVQEVHLAHDALWRLEPVIALEERRGRAERAGERAPAPSFDAHKIEAKLGDRIEVVERD